ncbi:unnamed protein product [Acanthosepion pharaonis]|uniref:Uncharacterized protein n=1 Tax=Acanthosepion pharaonis TaxID=158019 RepID=A0A812EG60_ACAPH|nr:unnamed protein product [Sepia pharaonis]
MIFFHTLFISVSVFTYLAIVPFMSVSRFSYLPLVNFISFYLSLFTCPFSYGVIITFMSFSPFSHLLLVLFISICLSFFICRDLSVHVFSTFLYVPFVLFISIFCSYLAIVPFMSLSTFSHLPLVLFISICLSLFICRDRSFHVFFTLFISTAFLFISICLSLFICRDRSFHVSLTLFISIASICFILFVAAVRFLYIFVSLLFHIYSFCPSYLSVSVSVIIFTARFRRDSFFSYLPFVLFLSIYLICSYLSIVHFISTARPLRISSIEEFGVTLRQIIPVSLFCFGKRRCVIAGNSKSSNHSSVPQRELP